MPDSQATLDAVEEWLRSHFADSKIETEGIFDRETHLFRVYPASGRPSELELSREVLEHQSPESIVRELSGSDTVERMQRDPSVRVQYFSDGINHFETRYVRCDGRQYRVVRDEKHNVRIFDANDKPLARTPQQMLVLPASVFQVQESEWCNRIRAWRGEGQ